MDADERGGDDGRARWDERGDARAEPGRGAQRIREAPPALPPALALDELCFCTLWASGPDTASDGVFRLLALRRGADGSLELFDRFALPFAGEGARDGASSEPADAPSATARMAREWGVTQAELAGAPHARELWPELRAFLGRGPVLVADSESFVAWAEALAGRRGALPAVLGLGDLAALAVPGRLASRRDELVRLLLPAASEGARRNALAFDPAELRLAWSELAARVLRRDPLDLAVWAQGIARAWSALVPADPRAAEALALALALLERPSAWVAQDTGALAFEERLGDGHIARALATPLEEALARVEPAAAAEGRRWASLEPLPPEREPENDVPLDFPAEDRRTLDAIFEHHLPALFARESGEAPRLRPSQHAVARAVAEAFDAHELLLLHAPTGTGKTLAYLVPALLWAARHGLRVGVATYTRALQEQAMDRDVPRALAALSRAGLGRVEGGLRVSVLKGRENYLCWRALLQAVPDDDDDGAAWLAWTLAATFALVDAEGDLDRLPSRAPVPANAPASVQRALESLKRVIRARTGCCTHRDDRASCAAELARRRAERSHVVLTNQAFALARQEFLRHLVVDECEHLHDVAHGTWSHVLALPRFEALLERLGAARASERSRAPLDRLARALVDGPTSEATQAGLLALAGLRAALASLERALRGFEAWREEAARGREERDRHALLREFCARPEAAELLAARAELVARGEELERAVGLVLEHLADRPPPVRALGRLKRALELARVDLDEALEAVRRWIPIEEGAPRFLPEVFHDVERTPRGELVIAARVLLPNRFLARAFHPRLGTGVFLSATTVLQDGFDASRGYLGLDRVPRFVLEEQAAPVDASASDASPAAEPALRSVRTFRAPEVFDYGRVLVGVPTDAPSPRLSREAQAEYVRRFLAHLGERTRGRVLGLFTNADELLKVGRGLEGFFRARRIPLWYQGMAGAAKEELGELFRSRVDSVLLGLDTFWYGSDFPGETLEYLVIARLPWGVPDRYHHAQCAALGSGTQWKTIYAPRALAKFRQGFGRLMRRESDRGCVFVLDPRALEPRQRMFLRELPLQHEEAAGARFVADATDAVLRAGLAHMDMLADVRRRGLDQPFALGGASEGPRFVREDAEELWT